MNNPCILSIDCGTQSIRGMIFDKNGNLIGKVKNEINPYFSINPGWAEQDAEVYWNNLCDVCKKLKIEYKNEWENIIGVSLTTMGDTVVVLDDNGKPLRPAILWLDQRMAKCIEPLNIIYDIGITSIGQKERVEKFRKEFRYQWIKENEPEIFDKIHKYMFLSGYLNYKLTNKFNDSTANQMGHIPFDFKRKTWARKYDIKSIVFPIDREKLVNLIEPGNIIGYITKEAEKETGIKAQIPVIATAQDKICETIGTGSKDLSSGNISLGSAVTIQTTSDYYFEISKFIPPYPSAIANNYNPTVMIYRGYWMISWFKKEFAMKEMMEAKKLNIEPEVLLDKRLKEIEPGSNGLMLQPYWGAEIKNPKAKGAIIGFSDVHTRVHIYRAIIEGINYALRDGIESIERKTKKRMEYLTVSGGGSQSDMICQIIADMLDRPVKRVQTYETSGLGAAIVGFVGLGIYNNFEEAVTNMVRYKDIFIPDKTNVEVYNKLYKVYKKIYPKLKGIYKDITDTIKDLNKDS